MSLDLVTRYSEVEVPAPLRTMDAADKHVAETTNNFFDRVQASLSLSYLALSSCVEIDSRMIVRAGQTGSDDFIEELWLKDRQLMATAVRIRDETNFQVTHFAKYPLAPESVEMLDELTMLEQIIDGSHSPKPSHL